MQRGVRMYHDQTTRPLNELRWELLTLLAHGSFVTVVDKTGFDGWLDPVTHERIGTAFAEARKKRAHFGQTPVPDVGVYFSSRTRDWVGREKQQTISEASKAHTRRWCMNTSLGTLLKPHRTTRQLEGSEGTEWPMNADAPVGPAMLWHAVGRGTVLTFAASPDFATASEHHIVEARRLVRNAVRLLNPTPRVEITAPANVGTVVTDDTAIFLAQLALNALWMLLFIGLHRPGLAFAEIVLLWLAIAAFRPVGRVAAWLLAPYLAWVSFAAALNFSLWQLNP